MFPDLLPVFAILFASWELHSYVPSSVTFKANRLQSKFFCSKFITIFQPYSFRCYTCNAQVFLIMFSGKVTSRLHQAARYTLEGVWSKSTAEEMKLEFEAVTMVGFNIGVLQYAEPSLVLVEVKMEHHLPRNWNVYLSIKPHFATFYKTLLSYACDWKDSRADNFIPDARFTDNICPWDCVDTVLGPGVISQIFLIAELFGLRKITSALQSLVQVNRECLVGRYPKLNI